VAIIGVSPVFPDNVGMWFKERHQFFAGPYRFAVDDPSRCLADNLPDEGKVVFQLLLKADAQRHLFNG